MKIVKTTDLNRPLLGAVKFGSVVVFHNTPAIYQGKEEFGGRCITLNEPYILVDADSPALLIRLKDGRGFRCSFNEKVEVLDTAELTL